MRKYDILYNVAKRSTWVEIVSFKCIYWKKKKD